MTGRMGLLQEKKKRFSCKEMHVWKKILYVKKQTNKQKLNKQTNISAVFYHRLTDIKSVI